MSQVIVRARVRPARVAVLINRHGTTDDFVLATRFLSRLWGGMYGPILPTNPSPPDDLTEFRLSTTRPDYVYSIGLDGKAWTPHVQDACQPRGFRLLDERFLKQLYGDHNEEHLTDKHLLNYLFRRGKQGDRKRPSRLVFWDPESEVYPLACALFGMPYDVVPNVNVPVQRLDRRGNEADAYWMIETHRAVVREYEKTWLELASQELNLHHQGWGSTGKPTIVLVEDLIEDLSLFWNLRMEGREEIPRWIIPLPISMVRDEAHAGLLKEWILEFFTYHQRSNCIAITSAKACVEQQTEFAKWLRETLCGTSIKFVDVWPPTNRIPIVTAFESEKLVEIRRRGREAAWLRPQSQVAEIFGSRVSWMVDLVEDAVKRRSPFELSLPPGRTTTEILNSPDPPTTHYSIVAPYGLGVDSVNIRCKNREELISHWIPTSKEVLEELLQQHGLRVQEDEKRACYLPALKVLGGLEQAASTLSGVRGAILQELAKRPATVHELKGRLKLSKGKIPELNRDRDFEVLLHSLTPTQKRVGRERLCHHWRKTLPRDSKLQSLLEHWVSNGILRRLFRVGSCPVCQTTHREVGLNITRPYRCPGCGSNIPIPESLVIEYQLQPILEAALKQGMMPVTLTGQFLRNLARRGFLWLPGLKYTHEGGRGDIDVVASCDGHLVLAECKSRDQSDPSDIEWPKIMDQVKTLASVGRACKASFVVLSMLIDAYPQSILAEVESIGSADLPIHLLNKEDLENGRRWINEGPAAMTSPQSLNDFLPEGFPEVPRPRFDEPREIVTGAMTLTIGTAALPSGQALPQNPISPEDE